MASGAPCFDRPSRERIRAVVRAYEGGLLTARAGRPGEPAAGLSIHLVRATSFVLHGNVGAFQIRSPAGNKGAEVDGPYANLDCYVRRAACFKNCMYLALEVCGGDNAVFEIINPAIQFAATVNTATIASGTNGTVLAGPDDDALTANATFGALPAGSAVWVGWDDSELRFSGVQIPCPP